MSDLVANIPGPFTDDVGCAVADNGDLYVIATTGDGELWLTSLPATTGSGWEPFVEVKTLVSDYPGPFLAVSIASPCQFYSIEEKWVVSKLMKTFGMQGNRSVCQRSR